MNTPKSALNSNFCADCGARTAIAAIGVPICKECLKKVLAEMKSTPNITNSAGETELAECPSCGLDYGQFIETEEAGCPCCFAAFRLTARKAQEGILQVTERL